MKKNDSKLRKEKLKDLETSKKKSQDDKNKSNVYNASTPRPFVSKTATDIYGQKNQNSVQNSKAPKKLTSTSQKSNNVSPMKDFLKSSPSSVSQGSRTDVKVRKGDAKTSVLSAKQTPRTIRNLPSSSVTVNSPIIKRKLNLEDISHRKELEKAKMSSTKEVVNKLENSKEVYREKSGKKVIQVKETKKFVQGEVSKEVFERQRTKTRTLDENEVKVLTAEMVDNNLEMLNLSRKLTAKPKAFYIDLEEEKSKSKIDKTSDEEVSYEDDFESYESDFDSYHSDTEGAESSDPNGDNDYKDDIVGTDVGQTTELLDHSVKEIRDEERMLDSGSYDLRDRSAKAKPTIMENIQEDTEGLNDKKVSLTDEGFQEMSSSSAVSSMKTVNVDLLDRPFFIDFTKSKQNKRKKLNFERLKQRAKDLLSMISLHEMSYSLFEMKPVSYDTFMATFGRNNYTQASVQTNEDSVVEETQTDEISLSHKWTQNPVEFSKHCTYLYKDINLLKYSETSVDYLTKFNYLINKSDAVIINNQINLDEDYKRNPLRIYLEQKDGVGGSEMLPYEKYKTKLKNNEYNPDRLKKVLKKFESRISNILNYNSGNSVFTDLIKSTKVPFSKGYITISHSNTYNDMFGFLNHSKITQAFFSESKSDLLMTVHRLNHNHIGNKYLVCLWDVSVVNREPSKVLIAIDNIIIGRFIGNTDGILVAALEDSTIHLWDLSEEATWRDNVANENDATNSIEIGTEKLTEVEKDREWTLKNSHVHNDKFSITCALHACSYTSSANIINNGEDVDKIVGLELTSREAIIQEGGRKIVGQVISLQRVGILTTWSIVQDKSKSPSKDLGKAYWSKMILEKKQTINLSDHIDLPMEDNKEILDNFNLNAAKRRLSNRKQEKRILKRTPSRPKSAISSKFEFDRPSSAASMKSAKGARILQAKKNMKSWENTVTCNNLKILRAANGENILVGKDSGEILCCRKSLGVVRVHRFFIASDTSSITSLEVSPHELPYFLAATDSGTVNLCSVLENRVLLTLDCRNVPSTVDMTERCQSDHKGRYTGTVAKRTVSDISEKQLSANISVKSLLWSPANPFCIYSALRDGTLIAWDLTNSDIFGKCSAQNAMALVAGNGTLTLITPEGDVQIHRFIEEQRTKENLDLFKKYVALL